MQLADLDLLVGRDRDDLLREHVERVARDLRLLDLAAAHRARDDRRLEQVGAELREDAALRDGAELVAGAADPLQPARDRLRRLDLDHEVDGAHVDPELERRGGDEARDPAGLQVLLDEHALLAREAAVVRAGDLALGELVQAQREPLGEAAVVDEDDRRAVRLDELRAARGTSTARSRRSRARVPASISCPSARTGARAPRSSRARAGPRPGRRPARSSSLRVPASTSSIGRPPETKRPISSSGRCVAERPIRWNGRVDEPLEPLDREREVRAALRPGDRVHLVEDQRLDPAERLARRRGEHEVERLGRRDQDVGRLLDELAALLRRRVAGADADAEARLEPGERPAEVALDVVVERLQRRDVEHAQPLARASRSAGRSRRGTR